VLLVVDANVLIDFASTDSSVLALVVQHVGGIHVPRDVLEEVEQLTEDTCTRLGMVIVDGTLEQLLEAGATSGGLSFQDRMCLILARDHGWTCVTNDKRLRAACTEVGVGVKWGLQLLLELVAAGVLAAADALALAAEITSANPWMGEKLLEAFGQKLDQMESG